MTRPLPLVLVPGLLCSARLYAPQVAALWPHGPVTVADHRRDDDMADIAERILADAPPRFALAGLSMGGYIALAMTRMAPERIAKLALLDTSARPDTPEQKAGREKFIAMAEAGKLMDVVETLTPKFLHRNRAQDETLKGIVRAMAQETGAEAFVRQTKGDHVARRFTAVAYLDPLSDLGAGRRRRRIDAARTVAGNCQRYRRRNAHCRAGLRPSVDAGTARGGQCGTVGLARRGVT